MFTSYDACKCNRYEQSRVGARHEYNADHNNCQNLFQSMLHSPFVKGCRLRAEDCVSEGTGILVRRGCFGRTYRAYSSIMLDAFDYSSSYSIFEPCVLPWTFLHILSKIYHHHYHHPPSPSSSSSSPPCLPHRGKRDVRSPRLAKLARNFDAGTRSWNGAVETVWLYSLRFW